METTLTLLLWILLGVLGWFALIVTVFCCSMAWHEGAKRYRQEYRQDSDREEGLTQAKLAEFSVRIRRIQAELQEVLEAGEPTIH